MIQAALNDLVDRLAWLAPSHRDPRISTVDDGFLAAPID